MARAPDNGSTEPVQVADPGVDYDQLRPFFELARWDEADPREERRICSPPPCVVQISYETGASNAGDFRQELFGKLFEMGQGIGQPSVMHGEAGDRTQAWIFWVPDAAEPAEREALLSQAREHVVAAGGPEI